MSSSSENGGPSRGTHHGGEITDILRSWQESDGAAVRRLMPLVIDDLHRLAAHYFQREGIGHTLQPTALVNEVFLRLCHQKIVGFENRRQFFAFASRLLRQVLVDHARTRKSARRGGGTIRVELGPWVTSGHLSSTPRPSSPSTPVSPASPPSTSASPASSSCATSPASPSPRRAMPSASREPPPSGTGRWPGAGWRER